MNIDKMVDDLIKAQEAIDEPIYIVRKTDREDEIHNSCYGSGVGLLVLQVSAISNLFDKLVEDTSNQNAKVLKRTILKTIEQSLDAVIDDKPTIH